MPWASDADEESHTSIKSVKSLLTVTTHVTVAGMVVDPIAVHDFQIISDVIDATATLRTSVAGVIFAIVTSNTTDGVAGDRHS